jgi:hypothetical protein
MICDCMSSGNDLFRCEEPICNRKERLESNQHPEERWIVGGDEDEDFTDGRGS